MHDTSVFLRLYILSSISNILLFKVSSARRLNREQITRKATVSLAFNFEV